MSATEPQAPRPQAPRPAEPAPFSDDPTDRIPVVAPEGLFAPNLPRPRTARCANPTGAPSVESRARRMARPTPIDRPSPSLAGDLAALAFDPPSQLLRAIPAQRTPSAAESAA